MDSETETGANSYPEFHAAFLELLKISSDVLEDLGEYGYDISSPVIVKAKEALNCYVSCYHNTRPHERYIHLNLFKQIFQDHRRSITGDIGVTKKWLNTPQVEHSSTSQQGKAVPIKIVFSVTKTHDITLYIGFIFMMSLKLKDEAEKKLKTASDEEYNSCEAVFHSEFILLCLKKIFREFASPEESKDFIAQIGALESDLGVVHQEEQLGDNISGIFNQVADLMKKSNIVPSDSEEFDITKIGQALGNVINNKDAQSVLGEFVTGIRSSNNLDEAITTAKKSLSDGRITGVVQQELNKVTDQGSSGGKRIQPQSEAQIEKVQNSQPNGVVSTGAVPIMEE